MENDGFGSVVFLEIAGARLLGSGERGLEQRQFRPPGVFSGTPTNDVSPLADQILPGSSVKRRLLWRSAMVYRKSMGC